MNKTVFMVVISFLLYNIYSLHTAHKKDILMADTTRINFVISNSLKNHIDKLSKRLSKKKDRHVSVGELIRKAIVNSYGKPENE